MESVNGLVVGVYNTCKSVVNYAIEHPTKIALVVALVALISDDKMGAVIILSLAKMITGHSCAEEDGKICCSVRYAYGFGPPVNPLRGNNCEESLSLQKR